MIFLISSTNAGLHEEGGDEGGILRAKNVLYAGHCPAGLVSYFLASLR